MFEVVHCKHAYGARRVVDIERWSAAQGEQWLLLGASGSGKSTLLHILAGVLRPSHGSVTIASQDLAKLEPGALDRFRGQTVGIVFQRIHLVAALRVLDNLLLAQYAAGLPQDATRARDALASLDLAHRERAYPHELSAGEAQRVAIARAVINQPSLLLADEPTSALDDTNCQRVLGLLTAGARACGATLVVATHDQRIKGTFERRFDIGAQT
jgi:putative ABC transport system ATP-binding protein